MSRYVLARIEAIQQELEELRNHIEGPKREVKLKGLWKGIDVSEEDIEEAKQAVFKDACKFRG
jgi:peptidoglycan hydrolase CwlO-like protein